MHMASPVKANTYRVYLNDEMAGLMGKICESTELAQSDLLSKLVAAGLAAVKANNGRITLLGDPPSGNQLVGHFHVVPVERGPVKPHPDQGCQRDGCVTLKAVPHIGERPDASADDIHPPAGSRQ